MENNIQEVLHGMSPSQQAAVYALLDSVLENDLEHSDFDPEAEKNAIFADAKKYGSLKDAFLEHAENYGIEEINAYNDMLNDPALMEAVCHDLKCHGLM